MPFEISTTRTFAAAHALRLPGNQIEPLHGHNWRVRVTVAADRMGLPTAATTATWVVAGGVHGPGGLALNAITTPLSGAVVAAWLLALALARRRRARPAARPRPPASPGQARAAFSTGVLAVDDPAKERAVVRMSSGLVVALLASLWLPGSMAGQDPQAPRARSAQRASGVELVGERSTPNPRMPIGPEAKTGE